MYDKAVLKLLQFSFCCYVISVCACHDPSSLEQTLKLSSEHINRQIMNDGHKTGRSRYQTLSKTSQYLIFISDFTS